MLQSKDVMKIESIEPPSDIETFFQHLQADPYEKQQALKGYRNRQWQITAWKRAAPHRILHSGKQV